MRKAKRGGDHLNGSFCKSRRASKNESLVSGGVVQGVRYVPSDCEVSYWSKVVASITLYNGDTILFSCSGIAMECQLHLTRFLTSANLVRAVNRTNKDHHDLKIKVRHEGNEVYMGVIAELDLDHDFAIVNVHAHLDALVGSSQHPSRILPLGGKVLVAIGCSASGEIIAEKVELARDSRVSENDFDSEISKDLEGGPLVSVDGTVVGMITSLTTRTLLFLPWGTIFKHLKNYWKKTGLARSKEIIRFGERPIGEKSNSHPEVHGGCLYQEQLDLPYMGYPKLPSSKLGAGMVLVNTFEETFGDIYDEGVWRKFSKRASCNLNRNVVALASFKEKERFFACTGFFIEWNKSTTILTSASLVRNSGDENKIEGLKIKVLLDNQVREGTLEHYSLHYNIALVDVKGYRALRSTSTLLHPDRDFKVAAIGRCFESGALMATSGQLVSWTGALDCDFLSTSTCKITKAGIGGPLVSLDGDVIGMNFYDKKIGTPFMWWGDIQDILESLVGNHSDPSGASFWKLNGDDKTKLNRWDVPMPCWRTRDYEDEDKPDDDEFDPKSGRPLYCYIKGEKEKLY